ncbi:MAG: tetratricopeptide repeat protein [Halieaceae bacterium]|nr:tetratricopeptide repeat protein [Halieaceae bacterium]
MSIDYIPSRFISLVLSALLTALPVTAQEQDDAAAAFADERLDEQSYQRAIAAIESRGGAYAAGLPESLLGLGQALQREGRHEEAIDVLRRGVHLTRINEGLYCAQQIPLLQAEIDSHKAQRDYTEADERQNYLYRVQMSSLQNNDGLPQALMAQARWQFEAYQLGLEGSDRYARLMNMWELYRMAMGDIVDREGESSPNLLPPLLGMLQTQYLISSYEIRSPAQAFGEDGRPNEALMRFNKYRAKSYQQGSAVLGTLSDIEQERAPEDALSRARSMVMLGDWRLWNGETEGAFAAYQAAEAELAGTNDAQAMSTMLFGEPVPLPDFEAVNTLPPAVKPEEADILLSFNVSDRGRVRELERLDENDIDERRASRLMRQLRNTTFRPRIEAGQPVEAEHIVKAFDIQ